MATSENNSPCALRNAQVEVKTLIYELRIVLEALSHGLKVLLNKPDTEPLKGELVILENFANQLVEALESYKVSLVEDWLSGRARRAWQVVLHLVEAAMAGFLAIMSYELSGFVRYDSFTTLPVSVRYLYLATAFGGALWSLAAIGRVLRILSRTQGTSDHQPGEYSE